ncbi:hypothetical protein RchiOBHm_Chr4g0394051 [Rosa chinensis]|uniref:Uncharacterized protein n=1 Tax=Rosa chinensis TaxID=74649 RepID=A0A2P6QR82_ROSCH|nr:hypothetical protein RchiOBHm_Chr4g0394051 [Rosa chinensis]
MDLDPSNQLFQPETQTLQVSTVQSEYMEHLAGYVFYEFYLYMKEIKRVKGIGQGLDYVWSIVNWIIMFGQ